MYLNAPQNAVIISSGKAESELRGAGAGAGANKALLHKRLTECRMAPQDSLMPLHRCRRQPGEKSSRRLPLNALPSRIPASTRNALIGPICAAARSRLGDANGATVLPASALR